MFKDSDVFTSEFIKFLRKSKIKKEESISIIYAFDSTLWESLANKIYLGETLDLTNFKDFSKTFNLTKVIIMGNKGFIDKKTLTSMRDYS